MTVPLLSFEAGPDLMQIDLAEMYRTNTFIQGATRSGKSWLLRFLMEQLFGRVQQVVFDTEGEYASLTELFDYALFSQGTPVRAAPANAALLVRRLLELGTSAVLDLSDLATPDQQEFVRRAVEELIAVTTGRPRRVLIVLDEIQRLAPNAGQGDATSTQALRELANRGLKRGLFVLAASQRHSSVDPAVRGGMSGLIVGGTPPGLDMETAGAKLGFSAKERRELAALPRGEFFALGAMFDADGAPREVHRVRSGPVRTRHMDAMEARQYTPPPASEAVRSLYEQLGDIPAEAEAEARTADELRFQVERLKRQLADAGNERPAPEPVIETVMETVIERVPVLTAEDAARLSAAAGPLSELLTAFLDRLGAVAASVPAPDTSDADTSDADTSEPEQAGAGGRPKPRRSGRPKQGTPRPSENGERGAPRRIPGQTLRLPAGHPGHAGDPGRARAGQAPAEPRRAGQRRLPAVVGLREEPEHAAHGGAARLPGARPAVPDGGGAGLRPPGPPPVHPGRPARGLAPAVVRPPGGHPDADGGGIPPAPLPDGPGGPRRGQREQ